MGRLFHTGAPSLIKFADEATISVSSGKGGDGCVAFRREKFVPFGGPAGGDGGKGGDVVFEVRRNLRTLARLRYQQTFKAQNGQPGMGRNMHGRNGDDIVIQVPPGTIVSDAETGQILKDFGPGSGSARNATGGAREGERWLFLKGGKGGWGNTHYKTSVNQAPRTFQPGQSAKGAKLKVELQLIADIGFVGFPNAGKSSLLDYFTNARPKIAPYPFTTKIPNLGMLSVHDRDIVLADIPGIIEGAHDGAGLGLRFLKHIARASALAFLVDLSDESWEFAFKTLRDELEAFAPVLSGKRRVLVATKLDLPEAAERFEAFRAAYQGESIFGISVFSGDGLDELREAFFSLVLEAESVSASGSPSADEENLFGLGEDEGTAPEAPLAGEDG
jgi:GTP-binding protein